MSKGPGRLDRIIAEAFAVPDSAYSTEDLMRLCYRGELLRYNFEGDKFTYRVFDKKHHVAVLRAAKRRREFASLSSLEKRGRELVFYNPDSFASFVLARLKSVDLWRQQGCSEEYRESDAQLRKSLDKGHIAEWDGGWWREFHQLKAQRNGDREMLAKLKAKEAEIEKGLDELAKGIKDVLAATKKTPL